jgi:hypothetical protein
MRESYVYECVEERLVEVVGVDEVLEGVLVAANIPPYPPSIDERDLCAVRRHKNLRRPRSAPLLRRHNVFGVCKIKVHRLPSEHCTHA